MTETGYVDAPLVRFRLERLVPDPTGEHRNLRRPFLGIGDFVSMPYLVSANEHSDERYRQERLFALTGIGSNSRVEIMAGGKKLELLPDQSVILEHPDGGIRVTLSSFSSKSVLHALEKLH